MKGAIKQIQLATLSDENYIAHYKEILINMKEDAYKSFILSEYLKIAFNFIVDTLHSKDDEHVRKKFLTLNLIKDGILDKNAKLINLIANNRNLQETWETVAIFDVGSQDDNRGRNLYKSQKNHDPELCGQYFRLTLELVSFLGTTYPTDAKQKPTKFKQLLDTLKQQQVKFPQVQLTSGISKSSQQQQQKLNNPPDNYAVVQTFSQSDNKQTIIRRIDELQISINEDIEMIFESLKEDEVEMDYVSEVLETYSKTLAITDKTLGKALTDALQYKDILSASQSKQIHLLKDFTEKFPQIYKEYIQKGSSNLAFEHLKDQSLTMAARILGREHHTPVHLTRQLEESKKQELQKIQHQQDLKVEQQRQIKKDHDREQQIIREREEEKQKQQKEMVKLLTGESQMKQESQKNSQVRLLVGGSPMKQESQNNTYNYPSLHDYQSVDMRQKSVDLNSPSPQFSQAQSVYNNRGDQKNYDEEMRSSVKSKNHFSMNESKKDINNQKEYDQYMSLKSSQTNSGIDRSQQIRYNDSRPPSFGGSIRNIHDVEFNNLHIQTNNNGNQKQPQYDIYSPISHSSGIRDFPFINQLVQLPHKDHYGRLCLFDSTQFQVLREKNQNEQQIRKWKLACLLGKGALYENKEIQIGVTSQLIYNANAKSMFPKITVFLGNKLASPLNKCDLIYEGDSSTHILVRPEQIDSFLNAGLQIKSEIIAQNIQPLYKMIKGFLEYSSDGIIKHADFILPFTLLSQMDFKDIDSRLFRPKWRTRKQLTVRSANFPLNSQILKSPLQLQKLMPRLCELIPIHRFANQMVEGNNFVSYKLGGIFDVANVEFMVKFIIYPDMQCIIKLISTSSLMEQLLNQLVFMLKN